MLAVEYALTRAPVNEDQRDEDACGETDVGNRLKALKQRVPLAQARLAWTNWRGNGAGLLERDRFRTGRRGAD